MQQCTSLLEFEDLKIGRVVLSSYEDGCCQEDFGIQSCGGKGREKVCRRVQIIRSPTVPILSPAQSVCSYCHCLFWRTIDCFPAPESLLLSFDMAGVFSYLLSPNNR